MDAPGITRVKNYLVVRWKARWPVALAAAVFCPIEIATGFALHRANPYEIIPFLAIFVVVGTLAPWHWTGEKW
jgi:hypothetical protein